eukprot:9478409-Pyramimonas_sp.AAC.4
MSLYIFTSSLHVSFDGQCSIFVVSCLTALVGNVPGGWRVQIYEQGSNTTLNAYDYKTDLLGGAVTQLINTAVPNEQHHRLEVLRAIFLNTDTVPGRAHWPRNLDNICRYCSRACALATLAGQVEGYTLGRVRKDARCD